MEARSVRADERGEDVMERSPGYLRGDASLSAQRANGISNTLRLRWVGWVLGQLERRALLVQDSPRPAYWGSEDSIDAYEFTQWLSKHLNVTGWRVILDEIRQHNERGRDIEWDPTLPRDLLDAVELVLQAAYVPMPEMPRVEPYDQEPVSAHATPTAVTVTRSDAIIRSEIVSDVERRDGALKNLAGMLAADQSDQEEMRMPAAAWLLAPRSAASVVKARATSARAFAELQRARSEAMLYALHAMENDTRGSAVLAHIEDLRQRLSSRLRSYCQEHEIPVPAPNTEEEANILLLLNAQLVALDDAQEEIARRGAELSREKIRMAQESARAAIESTVLPAQLEAKMSTNPVREKLLCEETRHWMASLVARAIGTAGGALTGVLTSTTEVLLSSITETAAVSGPPLIVFLLTLVAETIGRRGDLSLASVLGFLGTALWNGALIFGLTLTGFAVWRFLDKKTRAMSKSARANRRRTRRDSFPDRPWDDLSYSPEA